MMLDNNYKLIVLDINLPGDSGFDLCRELRKSCTVPIIFVCSRTSETDRITGLDLGADDYLPKPYSLQELLSRIKANLRRTYGFSDIKNIYTFGDLIIDMASRRVTLKELEIPLALREFDLLKYMIEHKDIALSKEKDNSIERRERYVSVIIRKCDEVSKLTNDLFLHSLTDLNKLKMHIEECNSKALIMKILSGIQVDNDRLSISVDISASIIKVDIRRLEQVYENVKYAGNSRIEILHESDEEYIIAIIRDYGKGIDDEDLPFVFNKFYRGKNTEDKPG